MKATVTPIRPGVAEQIPNNKTRLKLLADEAAAKEGDIAYWCARLLEFTRHGSRDPWAAHMVALLMRDRFAEPKPKH